MISQKLKEFLEQNNIMYGVMSHPEAFTAPEIAASLHVKGKNFVKTVILKANGKMIMAALSTNKRADLRKIKELTGVGDVRLANENEFKNLFPDCEVGAEPPFGNLYGMDVYADKELSKDDRICFNAGNHYETVEIDFKDYTRLVNPKLAEFGILMA